MKLPVMPAKGEGCVVPVQTDSNRLDLRVRERWLTTWHLLPERLCRTSEFEAQDARDCLRCGQHNVQQRHG